MLHKYAAERRNQSEVDRQAMPGLFTVKTLWAFFVPILIIALLGFVLRTLVPLSIVWNSPHDDLSSTQIIASLREGTWLGAWDNQSVPHMLLAKAPGYPLFIAYTTFLGLNPAQTCYIVYLVGAFLISLWLRPLTSNRAAILLFLVVTFNPVMFNSGMSRVYRDQLVAALALLALGAALQLLSALKSVLTRKYISDWKWWTQVVTSTVLLGISLGWLRITRGDTLWVQIAVVTIFVLALFHRLLIDKRPVVSRRGVWSRYGVGVLSIIVVIVLTALPVIWVTDQNQRYYGVNLLEDYSDGAFGEAMRHWASLPGAEDGQVISTAQRKLAYDMSPTARLLETTLENESNGWRKHQCVSQDNKQSDCDLWNWDSYGGYMGWALRDAAVNDLKINTPLEFQEYFNKLDSELVTICAKETVECEEKGLSPDVGQLDRVSVRRVANLLAGYIEGSISNGTTSGARGLPADNIDPLIVQTWVENINGASQILEIADSPAGPGDLGLPNVRELLRLIYEFLSLPALVLTVGCLFFSRFWKSKMSILIVAAAGGWMANLGVVAIFRAATLRGSGRLMEVYTMPSQSYFLVAITVGIIFVVTPVLSGARSTAKQIASPGNKDES